MTTREIQTGTVPRTTAKPERADVEIRRDKMEEIRRLAERPSRVSEPTVPRTPPEPLYSGW